MTYHGSTDPDRAARAARRAAIRRAHPDLGGSAAALGAALTAGSGDRRSTNGVTTGPAVGVRVTVTGRGAAVRRRVGVRLRRVRAHLPGGPTYHTL